MSRLLLLLLRILRSLPQGLLGMLHWRRLARSIMQTFDIRVSGNGRNGQACSHPLSERLRAIAFSMDILAPGLYVWMGNLTFRVGGCVPDDQPNRYPGTLHSRFGIALVLPGYRLFTTYNGTHDPDQTSN